VKVTMFHLMSHRELPDDFHKRYHSVWVDPPWAELASGEQYHDYYWWSLEEAIYAMDAGMDGICVNEHHQNAYGGVPAPNMMGGILAYASRDKDVALVQMGSTLPTSIPPVRVAEEYAMVDVLSGGRLVAGMPIGTPMDVSLCYGIVPVEQRERYYEAHDLIIKAWTEPEMFAWNGKHYQLPMVNLWPRPIQQPHPPIWVPGISSVSTWEFVARHDHAYCILSAFAGSQGINGAKRIADGFWTYMESQGHEVNPFRLGMALPVAVGETEAEAEELYGRHIQYFFGNNVHIAPEFFAIPGHHDYKSLQHMVAQFGSMRLAESLAEWSYGQFVDRQVLIGGTPDSVAEQLRSLATEMNIGHFMVLLQYGSMPVEVTKRNIDLFCGQVLPRLRDLFEGEHENRWWPQRLLAAAPPA
jgi:alkanesulfonate monooxygenase SsuD/methylene tetrahydromethanopterin reductase-like flavin-dependent oxidoreductase (luciferase family)